MSTTAARNEATVLTTCPLCGDAGAVLVDLDGYMSWKAGKLIQEALPTLTAVQREQLMTGICGPCWTKLWRDDE